MYKTSLTLPYWIIPAIFIILIMSGWAFITGSIFVFIGLIYILLITIGCMLRFKKHKIDILDPFIIFLGVLSVYAWSSGLSAVFNQSYDIEVLIEYFLSVIIGAAAFIVGYLSVFKKTQHRLLSNKISINEKRTVLLVLFVVCVGTIIQPDILIHMFNWNEVIAYGEHNLREARTAFSGPISYLGHIFSTLILFVIFYPIFKSKKFTVINYACLFLYCFIALLNGAKGSLLLIAIFLLIYRNYYIKKISIPLALAIFIPIIIFLSIYQHARGSADIYQLYTYIVNNFRYNPYLFLPVYNGEFVNPPQTLLDFIQAFNRGTINLSFGITWINDLLVYIPSFLYQNRPLPMSEQYMILFHPFAPSGHGRGWFILSDGYWAFGLLGVGIIMFIYGIILALFYRFFMVNMDNRIIGLVYSSLFYWLCVAAVRTGAIGIIKTVLMDLIAYAIIFQLSRITVVSNLTKRPAKDRRFN